MAALMLLAAVATTAGFRFHAHYIFLHFDLLELGPPVTISLPTACMQSQLG
jgi:hypothetical protein